ncbi:MAG TPA: hypothetical protein PKI14_18010, partial [Fervidobacterium sp.]|nr:hypothetical protein [Fervidobacterium sp.]
MELTGEDYSQEIKAVFDEIAKYQPKTKLTDEEQIRKDIETNSKLVARYKTEMESATTDVMRDYYAGLLQSALSSLAKSYTDLANLTGESFNEQIEAIQTELESLKVKPKVEFDIQAAWDKVNKGIKEAENLFEYASTLTGTAADDFYKAIVSGLSGLKNTLIDIAKADPTANVADTINKVNGLIDTANKKLEKTVTIEEKLGPEIEKNTKLAADYRKKMSEATSDVMKEYYSGLLQNVLSAQIKKFQTLMDETGKDYTKEIEALNNELAQLKIKPDTSGVFDVEKAWKSVNKTLGEVDNLQTRLASTSGQQSRDILNAMIKALNDVKGILIEIGKTDPSQNIDDMLTAVNQKIDDFTLQLKEVDKVEFTGSLTDFYKQFNELVSGGKFNQALDLLKSTLKVAKDLGVALDFSKLETSTVLKLSEIFELSKTDLAGAKNEANALLKIVKELAASTDSEIFKTLEETISQLINAIEREQKAILERQRVALTNQATLYNRVKDELGSMIAQTGEVGRLIDSILKEINFQVVQLEDGSYQLI